MDRLKGGFVMPQGLLKELNKETLYLRLYWFGVIVTCLLLRLFYPRTDDT